MNEEIKVNYRGFEISYREESECWSCKINDKKWYEKQTLKECKKSIDAFLKNETDFPRVKVYCIGRWFSNTIEKATVTSIAENGDIWIKDEKGGRLKINSWDRKSLIKVSDTNDLLVKQYMELGNTIKALTKEQGELTDKFELF